jgi:hypothetical protein
VHSCKHPSSARKPQSARRPGSQEHNRQQRAGCHDEHGRVMRASAVAPTRS